MYLLRFGMVINLAVFGLQFEKLKRQERKLFTVQKKFSKMIKSIVFKKGK